MIHGGTGIHAVAIHLLLSAPMEEQPDPVIREERVDLPEPVIPAAPPLKVGQAARQEEAAQVMQEAFSDITGQQESS